jgi:hypothetical protein
MDETTNLARVVELNAWSMVKSNMRVTMRFSFIAVCLACATGFAWAQVSNEPVKPGYNPGETDKSHWSTGRTVVPETKGVKQPQGWTGPITTGTGDGPPHESPIGQTPPGMQSAPEGSSKTTVEPEK